MDKKHLIVQRLGPWEFFDLETFFSCFFLL